jgi:hemoglobin
MKDISDPQDIKTLIDTFYGTVTQDDLLGPVFNGVAQVDWAHHLPVMYAFWEFLLLGGKNYTGNPIEKHHALHRQVPLKKELFDRWVAIFQQTVDAHFSGPVADTAKFKAFAIAETWKPKFDGPFAA